MARPNYAFTLDGKKKVKLDRFDPRDTGGLEKEEGLAKLQKLGEEFAELGNLLTFAGQDSLLVVLQGRDASGKDGTIRKVLDFSNMQTAHVHAFKAPSEEEQKHDFLWRVHRVVPPRGHITLFNRSHYEDVLAARVHKIVPKKVWTARYGQINGFEDTLSDSRTILLKFYLHISREEQYERLVERETEPLSAWKLNPNDWRDLTLWDELTEAYEDTLDRCSSPERPWYLVPADRKWFRNLAVIERIVLTLRPHRQRWIDALAELRKKVLPQVRTLRAAAEKKGLHPSKRHRD
jgi:PPK2 family polyphosphate:nucleotide phosphotransferase